MSKQKTHQSGPESSSTKPVEANRGSLLMLTAQSLLVFYWSWQLFKSSLHQAFPFSNLSIQGVWNLVLRVHTRPIITTAGSLCSLCARKWDVGSLLLFPQWGLEMCFVGSSSTVWVGNSTLLSQVGGRLFWGLRDHSRKMCICGGSAQGLCYLCKSLTCSTMCSTLWKHHLWHSRAFCTWGFPHFFFLPIDLIRPAWFCPGILFSLLHVVPDASTLILPQHFCPIAAPQAIEDKYRFLYKGDWKLLENVLSQNRYLL